MKALSNCTVLVTPTSYGREDPTLKTKLENAVAKVIYNTTGKPIPAQKLAQILPEVDGYIAGLDQINREALQNVDNLQIIARYGVGIDNVDLDACREKDIMVTNTPGANSGSVAELAIGLILSLMRQIPTAIQSTREGGWPRLHGQSLKDKTVGLIGFGHIGQCVAERLLPFGCRILASDPYAKPAQAQRLHAMLCDLKTLLSKSDIISLHLPALPKTINMVDDEFLKQIKPGSFLINTARGELIVEEDLLNALESGHLAGAALDAFRKQPPDPNNLLLNHPAVIATPHMGAHADDATNQMGWMSLNECLRVLQGLEPTYPVISNSSST